jgi:hypothetical protein
VTLSLYAVIIAECLYYATEGVCGKSDGVHIGIKLLADRSSIDPR